MRTRRFLVVALALSGAGTLASSQIKAFTLPEMVREADGAVFGEIVSQKVFRVDHPVDGSELYFTTLTIQGRSVYDGAPLLVDVTFHGGFLDEKQGVHNSEAPSADDVKVGNKVVAFYKWTQDMGGDVSANALIAAHGGLFRTVDGLADPVVLGRGQGYAIARNVKLAQLDQAVRDLRK